MKKKSRRRSALRALLIVSAVAASLAATLEARAQQQASASCSVAVDYVYNGVVTEQYRRDFVVAPGVPFVDDFSTATRIKTFTATAAREAGDLVVSMDYFNDVGTFHAIGFASRLSIRERGKLESTSGSNGFFASSGVTPTSVSGNHETNYLLTCRRG